MPMEAQNTGGQVLALLIVFGFVGLWAAVAVRRERIRDRRRLKNLRKVSGVRATVGHTTEDRSEA